MAVSVGAAGVVAASVATIGVAGYVAGAGISALADQTGSSDASSQSTDTSTQLNSQSHSLTATTHSTPNSTSSGNANTVPEPPATLATIGLAIGAVILLKILQNRKVPS